MERSQLTSWSQRLTGASLLVFANKTDIPGAMGEEEIGQVRCNTSFCSSRPLLTGSKEPAVKCWISPLFFSSHTITFYGASSTS